MRRTFVLILLSAVLFIAPIATYAMKSSVNLFYNGEKYETEHPSIIIQNTPYGPLELIEELFEVESSFHKASRSGTLRSDHQLIEFKIDQHEISVNGKPALIKQPALLHDNKPYVSLRWIGEYFGWKVLWDVLTQSVFLFQSPAYSYPNKQDLIDQGNPLIEVSTPRDERVLATNEVTNEATIEGIESTTEEIRIAANGPLEINSFLLNDPDRPELPKRLVINLSEAELGTALLDANGTQSGTLPSANSYVSSIRYSMFDKDSQTMRLVLDLSRMADYSIVQDQDTHEILIRFVDDPFVVVIDPGHGGKDPGATGASSKHEKIFTLKMAEKIAALVQNEHSIDLYLTRTEDVFISLEDRAAFANERNADLFISIHGNTFDSPISGSETYYYTESSLSLATTMHRQVIESGGLPDRNIRELDFRVLKLTNMPAVLLELGYLSNAQDEDVMLSGQFQDKVAAGIVKGIKEHLGL